MTEGYTLWLTGLPGAGKTTIGEPIAKALCAQLLDGDQVRKSPLSLGLGFSPEDRRVHLLRVAEVCRLLNDNRVPVVACFVSPYAALRAELREHIGRERFYEVFVQCSPQECLRRDPKGLWAKAQSGEVRGLTGHDAPYEPPEAPDLVLRTEEEDPDASVARLQRFVEERVLTKHDRGR